MGRVRLAVDVGGTKILGGLVDDAGRVVTELEIAAPRTAAGVDPGLAGLREVVGRLVEHADREGHEILAAGVGVPEYVVDDQVVRPEVLAPGPQPRDLVRELVGAPTAVEADVRCAARAEALARGLGPGTSAYYVSWGTGLSGALVLDGRPFAGRRGEALALGEWPVPAVVDPAFEGNLEQFAAGRPLGLRYEARGAGPASGREVVERAEAGDPVATEVVTSAAVALAGALAQVVLLLDPDVVVLGGGLGSSGSLAAALVARRTEALLHRPDPPPVEAAVTGARAGLLGAAACALRVVPA